MSYPRSLDEYAEKELEQELRERERLRARGICDYCSRPPHEPACKFPERHSLPGQLAATQASSTGETALNQCETLGARVAALTLDEYQAKAATTAIYPFPHQSNSAISYCLLGLAGEVGELCDKFKKVLRDDGGVISNEVRAALSKEGGDAIWYWSNAMRELGLSAGDVAQQNLDKLADRAARGVLKGSGDTR